MRKKTLITAIASGAAFVTLGMSAPAGASTNYPPNYPPVTTPVTTPATTLPPTGTLPKTGGDSSTTMALIGASLLGAGGVMVVGSRSRRRA